MNRLIAGVLICGVAAMLLAVVAPASAHIYRPTSHGKDWYFFGSTYTDDNPRKRKDPVNIMFHGYNTPRLEAWEWGHLVELRWDEDYGEMSERWCNDKQVMIWRDLHGGSTHDKSDKAEMTKCNGRQYHIRFWDDHEHAQITNHGALNQWAVGGVHHEKLVYKSPCCVTHRPDRDWDAVRVQAVKALHGLCSYRRWRYHAGADRTYQHFTNSGYIARIANEDVGADPNGCKGA